VYIDWLLLAEVLGMCKTEFASDLDVNGLMNFGYVELRLIIDWSRKVPGQFYSYIYKYCLLHQQMPELRTFFCGFRRESIKLLQSCSKSLSATLIIDERKLSFWRKMFLCMSIILRAILCLVHGRCASIGYEYGLEWVCSVSKDCVNDAKLLWQTFSILIE